MPRRPRVAPAGYVFHVLNRGVGRMTLFNKEEDYQAFERVLAQTGRRLPNVDLLSYCLMPNHWHLLLRPRREDALSQFMRLLTVTHTQRWHAHHHTTGTGPIYQGRFKSFPVETESYFTAVARYVERNALRAKLVERAQDWRWSSLWARRHTQAELAGMLERWPIPGVGEGPGGEPRRWLGVVNRPQSQAELEALRASVRRGRPLGSERWVETTAARLGLENTLRSPGRPRKSKA